MKFLQFTNLFVSHRPFADISGYDEIKSVLHKALQSQEPVHILLTGVPGVGKTRFLKAIEKAYPADSYFALASTYNYRDSRKMD